MRVTRALAAAAVGLALGAASHAAAAPAAPAPAAGDTTAVWSELQRQEALRLPPPDRLPKGGLWLQSSARGDSVVSALRLALPAGRRAATLVLTVGEDMSVPGPAAVDLCPPVRPWVAPEQTPGSWEARALPDCERTRLSGVPSADGATITFDLSPLTTAGTVDLVLTGPVGGTGSNDVTFAAPGPGSLELVAVGSAVPPPPGPAGEPAAPAVPEPAQAEAGSDDAPGSPLAAEEQGGVDAPLDPLPEPLAAVGELPALAPDPQAEVAPAPSAALAAAPALRPDSGRVPAALALAAALLWALRQLQGRARTGSVVGGPIFTLYRGTRPTRPR